MIIIIYITEGIYFAFTLEEAVILYTTGCLLLFCKKEILLLLFVQLRKNPGNSLNFIEIPGKSWNLNHFFWWEPCSPFFHNIMSIKLTFLRFFDNPLSKYIWFWKEFFAMTILGIINTEKTRKNIVMDRLFCIIYQNWKDIWDKLLVHIFCMIFPLRKNKEHDCSLFNTLSFGKVLMSNLFTFSRYQTKCVIEFLFETVEDVINFKACVCYFYQIITFSPNDSPSKKKLFSFSR